MTRIEFVPSGINISKKSMNQGVRHRSTFRPLASEAGGGLLAIAAHPGRKLAQQSPEYVERYRARMGRLTNLKDWQFRQIVDAIQMLFKLAGDLPFRYRPGQSLSLLGMGHTPSFAQRNRGQTVRERSARVPITPTRRAGSRGRPLIREASRAAA
jgi:hypothetical protein